MEGGVFAALIWTLVCLCSNSVFPNDINSCPPHIVFIIADDLGWNDVGWVNPRMHTPNLDHLARNGIILNNTYVQPLCSPTRGAIMSGYYPFHTGLQHEVILWRQPAGLNETLTLLPEALKRQGYATHAIGKWHLGFCKWKYTPTERGFDSFLGYYNADEDYYTHEAEGGFDFRRDRTVDWKSKGIYSTFLFRDRALDILNKHDRTKPLFLYLAFQSVHFPMQVPQEYEEKFCSHIENVTRRTLCGMLACMDEAIGAITIKLEDLGYTDNILLVFTTDNGGDPTEGGNNWPLRGAKDTMWEGGTRAASFLYSRNLFRKTGTVHDGLIHAVDWFPTLMTLAGGKAPDGIDGVSQWTSIVDEVDSPRTEFVYNIDLIEQNAAIRVGDWKLIQGTPGPFNEWYPPSDKEKKYEGHTPIANEFQLFNIKDDPTEQWDVKEGNPRVLEALQKLLEEWRTSLVPAKLPLEDPAADPSNFDGVWSPGWC